MTNCTSSPAVISPVRTSCAPIHRTPTTPAKARNITTKVITARNPMRGATARAEVVRRAKGRGGVELRDLDLGTIPASDHDDAEHEHQRRKALDPNRGNQEFIL